jgi:hypothetical protein
MSELGVAIGNDARVWTGTAASGGIISGLDLCTCATILSWHATSCLGWTPNGGYGLANKTGKKWTAAGVQPCTEKAHIYCVEDPD